MDQKSRNILNEVNSAISRTRGFYFYAAKRLNIGYNELLILYLLHETPTCTQKQICEGYALPKQTVNNIISDFLKKGYLTAAATENDKREKKLELTKTGVEYAEKYLAPLLEIEQAVVEKIGYDRLDALIEAARLYGSILHAEIEAHLK